MATILLADDERAMRESLRTLLVGEGYTVRMARDGADALMKFAEGRPDLVLLDVMMPKLNGYVVCTEIRKTDRCVPILFLTSKDAESEEIRGLDLGADDFISKAESEPVLLSRIRRAILRAAERPAEAVQKPRQLRLGVVTVDFDRHAVLGAGKNVRELTVTEEGLLLCLAAQRGVAVSTDDILTYLRGKNYMGDPSSVRTHVKNLRKKLGPAGHMIVNVISIGYYLVK